MSNQLINGGDLTVKCLLKEGVTKIFGIVGGELLRIYDAIERWGHEEGIETVMVRHEQAGGHMADAWARATGGIGVCLGTVGPGVTHLVPAVATANADSIPLLVIGAQIGRMFEDTGILQGGIDQIALMKPITKAQIQIEEPDEIPRALQKAIKIALSGRMGPVYVDFRETALVREASEEGIKNILNPEEYRPLNRPNGSPKDIKQAVKILENAKNPIIVAGGGVIASEASNELKILSETYLIPTGTTINGIGSVGSDLKTFLDSYLINSSYRTAATEADVVLSLGCKWDYSIVYGAPPIWNQDQKIIQVDIDPKEIGKNRAISVGIIGDCKAVINQLLHEMEKNLPKNKLTEWAEWNDYLQDIRRTQLSDNLKILKSKKIPMKPERLVHELFDFIPEDTQIVLDGGDIVVFSYKFINHKPRPPRSTFFPISMGHLGVGIPYAIGVKMAKPDKLVVCLTGDGSFMFNIQELETAVRLKLPIIIVIANNCAWGMIKSYQKNSFRKRYCDVDFPPINYSEIAKGFGCYAEKIEKPEDIRPAIQRAIDSKKPAVIDVDIAFETPTPMRFLAQYKKNKGLFGE
ncbi:MAG: thiamine pyrophosphate-binding protein [Candidatus Lokiarchaeota archaeon]|nr:thiamine pyrophosphate-binding protein [Candidatus Lokiarchaeota archaeon]